MSMFTMILLILSVAVALAGLSYTFGVGRRQKAVREGFDDPIPKTVQERPYVRNPVFWACLLFAAIVLFFIAYYAVIGGYF